MRSGGSELCLACGLCCSGALYATVTVHSEHVESVRTLGLTVEKIGDGTFTFRQPCPLHEHDRCSAYPNHPPSCQGYRCALLRKYEAGDVTLERGLKIVRSARQLIAGNDEQTTSHDAKTERLLRAVTLDVHLKKHFRLPKECTSLGADRP